MPSKEYYRAWREKNKDEINRRKRHRYRHDEEFRTRMRGYARKFQRKKYALLKKLKNGLNMDIK